MGNWEVTQLYNVTVNLLILTNQNYPFTDSNLSSYKPLISVKFTVLNNPTDNNTSKPTPILLLRLRTKPHYRCAEPNSKTYQSLSSLLSFFHFAPLYSVSSSFSNYPNSKTLEMVSKAIKKTPIKSIKDHRGSHRRHRKRSPAKIQTVAASSAIFSSIKKNIFTCKRRLAKIFAKFACIGTPCTRYKGYKVLKTGIKTRKIEESRDSERETICKALFFDERLPPLISPQKRTVFLDLDETLVHSKPDPPPQVFDFVVRPVIDGEAMNFYVLKRPGVDEFLEAMAAKYELVVFTAGLKEYASLVLDGIDVKGLISYRLYRDSCKAVDGKYIKDLSEMGRELKRVAIVDDNPNCYMFQPENAIPVRPFVDDLGDRELDRLVKFFYGCDCFEDMRDAVRSYVSEEQDQNENLKGSL